MQELERYLAFAQSELAQRIMALVDHNYRLALESINICKDETGRAKIDTSMLRSFEGTLSPGVALSLGLKLLTTAVDAIDANALRLVDNLMKQTDE